MCANTLFIYNMMDNSTKQYNEYIILADLCIIKQCKLDRVVGEQQQPYCNMLILLDYTSILA